MSGGGARQSSAHGTSNSELRGPKLNLVAGDRATQGLASLKRVKFLDPEFEAPARDTSVGAGRGLMSAEQMKRKENMDKQLQHLINSKKVAHIPVPRKSKEQMEAEKQAHEEELKKNPLARFMDSTKPADDKSKAEKQPEHFADGFIRSKRNTQLRVKQELMTAIQNVEEEKTALIQKLNRALIKLDRQNATKRELGEKLLEQVRFVRDLQRAASNGDDIEGVVSVQMKIDFQREKELNFRLKEELQRCEKERLRLLERIKLLSGEKEIEVENADGMKRTFKVTQINIQRILEELRAHKDRVGSMTELVEQSKDLLRATEGEIATREADIEAIRRENDDLVNRLGLIENKYRDTVYLQEGARDRMGGLHRMHVKLLATRQLEETLERAFDRSKKEAVQQMLWVTRGYVNQFGALYRLRNLIAHKQQKLAKNALIRWFKLACDPLMLLEQNRKIPDFFAKGHTERLVFSRDFEAWMKQKSHKAQVESQLDTIKGKLSCFWKRELKLRFQMWKDNVRGKVNGLKILQKFSLKMRYSEVARAFTRWTAMVKEQDFTARLHAMAVVTAQRQSQTSVFYAWKLWALTNKKRRVSLMRRCLRSLHVAVKRRHQLQQMALSALGFQKQAKRSILKECFDALRQNKENEKLLYLNQKLTSETQPAVSSLKKELQQIDAEGCLQEKTRATLTVMTFFGKRLQQAFNRWKAGAQAKGLIIDGNIKQRLIKLYRIKLEKAFNLWRVNRSALVIDMQTMQFEDFQNQNQVLEIECRTNEVKIVEADRSSKNLGAKHIKKLVTAAYQRNMKAYLDRWAKKNAQSNTQQGGAERILRKIRTRYLRMAWNRYRFGVAQVDQDARNETRLSEVRIRLHFKQKKRTFQAIRQYAHRYRTARQFLKTLIMGIDKHNKNAVLRRWTDFNHQNTLVKINGLQDDLVNQLTEAQNYDSQVADDLQKHKDKNAKLSHTLKVQCQKTLQKWTHRLHGQGMAFGFSTWKKAVQNLRHRERLVLSLRGQMQKWAKRQAFVRWSQYREELQTMELEERIHSEEVGVQQNQLSLKQKNDHRRAFADKSSRKMAVIKDETDYLSQKKANTMSLLVDRHQDCFYTSKLNYIFHGWKAYMDRRRRCCRILTDALRKTALTKTFIIINNFARETHKSESQAKGSGKLFRLYSKFRLKSALHQWREHEYENVVMVQMQTDEQMCQMVEDFSVKKEAIKAHHVAVKSARNDKNTAQKWFTAWQVYASEERDCRMRTQKLKEALRAKKIQKALLKWKMRKEVTIKMRAFLDRGKFLKRQINMKTAFIAWSKRCKNERRLATKVNALMTSILNFNSQSAFDMIRRYAAEMHSKRTENKSLAKNALIRCMLNYNEGKLRVSFNKMRQWHTRCATRNDKLSRAFANLKGQQLRSYFMTWKAKAHQTTVFIQNEEEDGPSNLKAWQLRQDNFNLIKMLKEDGITSKEIQGIHKEAEYKYKVGVEKSLCRMLCKSSEGLDLLPACLDRWKKYTKLRKIWRRILADTQIRVEQGDEMSAKLWAFRRLQYTHSDREQALRGKPLAQLKKMCVLNVEKLDKLADAVEARENEQGELTGQRNVLLKGQMAGQKLAFALSIANQHRRKMRVLSRFHEHGNELLSGKIADAIKGNLGRIAALKNQISKLEDDNDNLAKQNDEFRLGAMEGITMVKHVEALTDDRDKLSVDLADKALTIRKLLEDNQYLQSKLTNAQSQTVAILEAAKQKCHKPAPTSPTLTAGRNNDPHTTIGAGGVAMSR